MIGGCFWEQLAGAEKSWMSRMVDVKKTKMENASRHMKTIVNNKKDVGWRDKSRAMLWEALHARLDVEFTMRGGHQITWIAIREGNDNVDGGSVISLSSDDLATDPSHSTHHTAHPSKAAKTLLSAIISCHCMGGFWNCPKLIIRYHWEAIFSSQSHRIQVSTVNNRRIVG